MSSATPRNILIIRPSALGDVARSVPALVSLRRAFPEARIDWIVEQGFEDVLTAHPALSSVIAFPKREIKAGVKRFDLTPLGAFWRGLRNAHYDMVFDLQGLARSAAMCLATGATNRYGLADAREFGWLAFTHRAKVDIEQHTVDRMLAVVQAAGVEAVRDMRLYTPAAAASWRDQQPWAAAPYAVLAPTSRWPAKQWPANRFAALCTALRALGQIVLVVGGKSERPQCAPLLEMAQNDSGVIDLVGGTSVGQLMAAIERSSLVVANDSAALHIAVGFDRQIIALFGPTRVHRVGPYLREQDVVQHVTQSDSLNHKVGANAVMMERISADEVVAMATERLSPIRA